ncbi:MAG: 5-oxoprolinase subunit PxpB [Burkholderiales bacterium]
MRMPSVRFLPSGDTAIVVEFGDRVDHDLNAQVLRLSARVRAENIPGVVETLPTLRSLLVHYDPLVTDNASVTAAIERLLRRSHGAAPRSRLWRIPACYEGGHAPDLEDVAKHTGLAVDEVVRLHRSTRFHVYMVGFSPGFPYMGDLPESLALPRRKDPRVRVPAGSIAIATSMTAIYPVESPGGWHLIGATPVRLFDARWPRPALLSPGDRVSFEPVGAREYDEIRSAVAANSYEVPCEAIEA